MKHFIFVAICLILSSCNKNREIQKNTSDTNINAHDTSLSFYEKPDLDWYKKDLFIADEQNYMIDSIGEFRSKFDSIQNHYKWGLKLSDGISGKDKNYNTLTFNVSVNPDHFNPYIKIIARLDNKYKKVIKLLVFADGLGDDFDIRLIRVIKATILSTLNSNYNADDAELIIHQAATLNRVEFSAPGVLLKDGHRYESHYFKDKFYFGVM